MTGPRGGKTTVTPGGLRRVTLSLDEVTIQRIEDEVAAGRGRSCSEVVRALARRLLPKVVT
jgi:Arc/MetJ-type ribon-helix-helix transcriptional regulator